jgi:hypothetical protein
LKTQFKVTLTAIALTAILGACTTTSNDDTSNSNQGFDQAATDAANERFDSEYKPGELKSIQTPNTVETSIGTLQYIDGAPTPETAQMAYDHLDTARAADVFLKAMPAASVKGLMDGPRAIGADDYNKVMIMDKLMNSKSLFLTANTSTLYVTPVLDLKKDGPMVIDVPKGMLGAFNDAWFRYMGDIGPFGPDRGQGGKFLVLPPHYEGEVPDGYHVVKSKTYRVWTFMRGSIANGVEAGAKNIKDNLKVYPLSKAANPEPTEFVSGSDKYFNTVHSNDASFYHHVDEIIQYEPIDAIDVETRGLLASIGIVKGQKFAPDARMQKILADGVAIGNATARSIVWYPRVGGSVNNMKGVQAYPDTDSAWIMAWVDKNVFFNGKNKNTMNSDARVMFHYPYTAVTPAMAVSIPGKGSDYVMAFTDSEKQPLDGSKTYQVTLPANAPAADFWAFTIYDTQTRSMLQTSQPFPTLGSQDKGLKANEDGSYTVYFGPKAPAGKESNWLETIPGKSWFNILRMYGPEKEWVAKTWRPSEVIEVK